MIGGHFCPSYSQLFHRFLCHAEFATLFPPVVFFDFE
jgi:hypothetical protein